MCIEMLILFIVGKVSLSKSIQNKNDLFFISHARILKQYSKIHSYGPKSPQTSNETMLSSFPEMDYKLWWVTDVFSPHSTSASHYDQIGLCYLL